jgi:phage terminase large subunit-like protein
MVVAERIEPVTVRERLRDGTGREFRTMGHLVNEFFERQLVHTKGRWRGKPFALLPHQKRRNLRLFEVVPDPILGWRRRYRWALIMEPKKNGKTEWAAGVACFALFEDVEESPEIACGANSDDQAKLVFGAAKTMVELSAGSLAGQAGETTLADRAVVYQREIILRDNPDSKIVRVSATVGSNDGKNLSMVVLDELHEAKGERGEGMWNVLTNATGAREQPLVVQISTAGWDLDTICGRQYEHGKAIQAGETVDDTFYFECWEAPEGADYRSPATWQAANPAYGVTVQPEFYEDQLVRKTKAQFERYYLDRWTAGENPWIPAEMWDACQGEVKFVAGLPTFAAIDASTKNDSTGIILFQQQGDKWAIDHRAWERPMIPPPRLAHLEAG